MNPVESIKTFAELTRAEKAALIKLLSDEDESIFKLVRDQILAYGDSAHDWLKPLLLNGEPLLRRRARAIIAEIDARKADNRFLTFCVTHDQDLELETGIWLLAQTAYPEINTTAYRALLDSFAHDIGNELPKSGQASAILACVNEHLFQRLGFQGNEKDYYDPDNSYLNRVIDRRTGNPISLCVIYHLVARRLNLPIVGIGMPSHFVCRYQSTTEEYYIDAFNRGKLLRKSDCVQFLQQTAHGYEEGYLAPTTPRSVLLRMCSNLHLIYSKSDMSEESERMQRYIVALAK